MSNISKAIEKWFHAYTFKIQDQFDEGWLERLVVIQEAPNSISCSGKYQPVLFLIWGQILIF